MTRARLSVVVVSFGRPAALKRCLISLSQQVQAGFEVVVVADPQGQAAVRNLPVVGALKLLPQPEANISAARNAGIRAAAGDIVAFIDDDAVAEPTWTSAIAAAFEDADLSAMTGPVLGRNGISLQWGPKAVNALGQDIEIGSDTPIRDGFFRKLQGTNMAVRRDVLSALDGFDEAFHFFLDETDLAFRLGQAGYRSAWVAGAVVHHGYAASTRRTEDRVPLSLFDIGASTAVFLRKHAANQETAPALRAMEVEQSARVLRFARARKINASQMRALMESLKDGLAQGADRGSLPGDIRPNSGDFDPFQTGAPPPHHVLSGRPFQRARLRKTAAELVAQRHPVSLFVFEPTPRKHKVLFTDGGWWEHSGGLFGPSERSGPRLQFWSFQKRVRAEVRRISATRAIPPKGNDN